MLSPSTDPISRGVAPDSAAALAAVLFDMDGTLVDSEPVWDRGLRELANSYGGELSADARVRMVGAGVPETMRILHDDIAQPWRDYAASVEWVETRVAELFAAGLVWRPGARALLAAVRAARVPTALVTATRRSLVDVALETIGSHSFDARICGDDVERGKPDPQPYVAAAAALGVDPRACVAIEDSPTGVASALAAGCVVVAVPGEAGVAARPGLVVLDSLEALDVDTLRGLVMRSR